MRRLSRHHAIALTLASVTTASLAWGFRTGPNSGYSGGPVGNSANCTECHHLNQGAGRVELRGAPRRYRPDAVYDLTVRVSDPDRLGAGFEISAESGFAHRGVFSISDPTHTQFADGFDANYVTHSETGVADSVAQWSGGGNAYEYQLQWRAPLEPQEQITFFVSALAINDNASPNADRYYRTYARSGPATAGDMDGDGDVDLIDAAAMQVCHEQDVSSLPDDCGHGDLDSDTVVTLDDWTDFVALLIGPTSTVPAEYALADAVRGGQLYDRWWTVIGAAEPTGNHPLYPIGGAQNGSVTFRCKECHGWDYKGVAGQYGTGSHLTGIRGVLGTSLAPRDIFNLLIGDPQDVPNGHHMTTFGMTEPDIWDVVRFALEGVVETNDYIGAGGSFTGDEVFGSAAFSSTCFSCHGEDGTEINFGTPEAPEYVGTVAIENPWEFLHKIRFGDPGTSMPSTALLEYSAASDRNLGTFAQTLPTK